MKRWKHKIAVRHLMTEHEDPESIKKSMNAIADVLEKDTHFNAFWERLDAGIEEFRKCEDVDEANSLFEEFWDYCDEHSIWVEIS